MSTESADYPRVQPGATNGSGEPADRLLRELIEIREGNIESFNDSVQSYDSLHAQGHLRQWDSFYLWLLSLLPCREGQRLLDVSCGQGRLLRFAEKKGLVAMGLDHSRSALQSITGTPPPRLQLADAEQLPYKTDAFDYVTNIGSLEHYFNPTRAVREMARVLRPRGRALVLLPNTFGLLGNILYVWRKGDVFNDGQPLQRYGTPEQWRKLLEGNGLKIQRIYKYERPLPRTWGDFFSYLRRPHKLGRVFLSLVIPKNLSSFLVFLCLKSSRPV
jgi:SAM-dependent methyltransferase